MAEVNHKIY